ncbi:MAG: carboxypeptidase-like regulatory domain-containing protein, partial [Candidatus Shapirobacteria bacterium]
DLDLTKNINQNEDDIVMTGGRLKSNLWGNKLKDAIGVIGIKKGGTKEEINIELEAKPEIKKIITEKKLAVEVSPSEKVEEKVEDWKDQKANLNLKTEKLGATGKAIFGSIPMPDIPEVPNVIVGMATNMEGAIIDGVIIEVQDEQGNPSRVLKTNSLGQFKITTPLANGRYLIIAEKDGYNFDRVNIDLNEQIVQPIRIISNN